MKHLITLLILGSLVAFGGAFVGQWKIPGLEKLPTMASMKVSMKAQEAEVDRAAERRLEQGAGEDRPAGYFATGVDSATGKRNKQLQNAGKEMGVE
jgi:cadmium resistance protein CadD (predicted permease)